MPSVLYVLAPVASVALGCLTLYLLGEEQFLDRTWLMIGGFMVGFCISMVVFFAAIVSWASRGDAHRLMASARRPVPSILYVLATLSSVALGCLTLYLIGDEPFQGDDRLMVWAFMAGFSISMAVSFAAIARWTSRADTHSRGRITM